MELTYRVRNDQGDEYDVDESKLDLAENDGFFPVVKKGNEEYQVPKENLERAFADGFQLKPSDKDKALEADMWKRVDQGSGFESFLTETAKKHGVDREMLRKQALFHGYDPSESEDMVDLEEWNKHPIANALTSTAGQAASAIGFGLPQYLSKKLSSEREQPAIDEVKNEVARRKGGMDLVSDVIMGNTIAGPALKVIGEVAPAVEGATKTQDIIRRYGPKAAQAATNIGLAGLAGLSASNTGREAEAAGEVAGKQAAIEGVTNIILPGGLQITKEAWRASKPLRDRIGLPTFIKRLGQGVFGVHPANVEAYMKNPEAINNAPSKSETIEAIDTDVANIKTAAADRVAAAQREKELADTSRKMAGNKYASEVYSAADTIKSKAINELDEAKASYDAAAMAAKEAKDSYKAAGEQLKLGLKQTLPPHDIAARLVASVDNAQNRIFEQSEEAFDILEKSGKSFPISELKTIVQRQIASYKTNGVLPSIGEQGQAVKILLGIEKELDKFDTRSASAIGRGSSTISAEGLKRFVQNLDSISSGAYGLSVGEIAPKAAAAVAQTRGVINEFLTETPAYRNVMRQIAPEVELISQFSKKFPSQPAAVNRIMGLGNVKSGQSQDTLRLLTQYDDLFGTNFAKEAETYRLAQESIKYPGKIDEMIKALPERQAAISALKAEKEAKRALEIARKKLANQSSEIAAIRNSNPDVLSTREPRIKDPQYQERLNRLEQQINPSYIEELTAADKKAIAAQAELDRAIGSQKAEIGTTNKIGPGSTENIAKSAPNDRGKEALKQLRLLEERTGKRYIEDLKNAEVRQSFEKPNINGSRRTTAFAGIGGAAGGSLGGLLGGVGGAATMGTIGSGIGYVTGAMLDYQGGRVYKKLIDAYMNGNQVADKYLDIFTDAARRGGPAIMALHSTLLKRSPEYAQVFSEQNQ